MNAIVASFKRFSKETVKVVGVDVIAFGMMFLLMTLFGRMLYRILKLPNLPATIFEINPADVESAAASLKQAYVHVLVLAGVMVILLSLVWAFSRAVVWRMSAGKEAGWKAMLKMALKRSLWFILGIVLLSILGNVLLQALLGAVFIYLSMVMMMNTAEHPEGKFLQSFQHALEWKMFLSFLLFVVVF